MSFRLLVKITVVVIVAFIVGAIVEYVLSTRQGASDHEHHAVAKDFLSQNTQQSVQNTVANQNVEYTPDERTNIQVYKTRNKSVVNITTEVLAYNWFFEPVPQEGGIGSGSVIDTRGYILTNNHVIANASKVFITFWNKDKVEGHVIGKDVENDLAVIKVDTIPANIQSIPLGDSVDIEVGQKVLAIGNPFGLDRTLTTGIISGMGRPIRSSNNIVIRNMIQTDASINPGNSGGPLLDGNGNLIGVNTLIYSPSKGSVGIGFAVPAETAKRVVADLIQYGQVQRGWIEWKIQPLFYELVEYAKLPVQKGLLVNTVDKNGNADKAEIRGGSEKKRVQYGRSIIYLGGDIIVRIGTVDVDSVADLLESLERSRPGDKTKVTFYRNGKLKTTYVTLAPRPDNLDLD